jgi:type IV pilus assembly protein PilA
MFRKWREARNEEGFTLIELLVVVIIIGILAAIAIPAFLNQRERAWQSELTSAVRNSALDLEAEATAIGGDYLASAAGNTAALNWINTNVNSTDAAEGSTAGEPIVTVRYVPVRTTTAADGTTTHAVAADTETATGFFLCMEHARITEAHSVQYRGGSYGTGVQDFARVVCPAAGNLPAA